MYSFSFKKYLLLAAPGNGELLHCEYTSMFSQPKNCSHFSYIRSMECVFQREGNTEMLKQENLNAMCTFSSNMDHLFVLINGIFRLKSYAVNFITKACVPPHPLVNLRTIMTHKVNVKMGIRLFSLGFC